MKLDTLDRRLLELLQNDSKQTNKELSNKLTLSVTAVYERIKKIGKSWSDRQIRGTDQKREDQ